MQDEKERTGERDREGPSRRGHRKRESIYVYE